MFEVQFEGQGPCLETVAEEEPEDSQADEWPSFSCSDGEDEQRDDHDKARKGHRRVQ